MLNSNFLHTKIDASLLRNKVIQLMIIFIFLFPISDVYCAKPTNTLNSEVQQLRQQVETIQDSLVKINITLNGLDRDTVRSEFKPGQVNENNSDYIVINKYFLFLGLGLLCVFSWISHSFYLSMKDKTPNSQ